MDTRQYILDNFEDFSKKYFSYIFLETEKRKILWNWHLDLFNYEIYKVLKEETYRFIFNLSPGSTKTDSGITLATMYMGFFPNTRMILVSGTEAVRDKYMLAIKTILNSPLYKMLFPDTSIDDTKSNTQNKFYIKGYNGFFKVYSAGDKITGEDADFLLVDDLIDYNTFSNSKEPFKYIEKMNNVFKTLLGRLREQTKKAVVGLIMQRICKEDTTDFFVNILKSRNEKYDHIIVPAKCDLKEDSYYDSYTNTLKFGKIYYFFGKKVFFEYGKIFKTTPAFNSPDDWYNGEKARFGSKERDFMFQYQQKDNGAVNRIFSLHKIRKYKELPTLPCIKFLSIDCAYGLESGDRTAIGIFNFYQETQELYLTRIFYNQLPFQELYNYVDNLINMEMIDITLIEGKANGKSLIQSLENKRYGKSISEKQRKQEKEKNLYDPIVEITPTRDKVSRASESNGFIELGKLYFPETLPDMTEFKRDQNLNAYEYFLTELREFPNYIHDDGVDMISQLLSYIKARFYKAKDKNNTNIMSWL